MFQKKKCERCGTEYRMRTISENRGKYFCNDCIKHCSVCGKSIPMSNWFGQSGSLTGAFLGPVAGSLRDSRRAHIGSGLCNVCFYKQEQKPTLSSKPSEDVAGRLQKLKNLLDSKLITQEEYEKKRSEIISQV